MSGQTKESSIEDYWKVSNDLDDLRLMIFNLIMHDMQKEAMNLIKDIQKNFDLICTNAEKRLIPHIDCSNAERRISKA